MRECTNVQLAYSSRSRSAKRSPPTAAVSRARFAHLGFDKINSTLDLHRCSDRSPTGMPVAISVRDELDNPYSIGPDMKNPWMKKNPFLSMWLSGANAVAGSARGHATAAAKRGATAFWTAALAPPKPKKKRRTRS